MVLRRSLKTIQIEENSFQVLRHFETEERSKKWMKTAKNHTEANGSCTLAHEPCAPVHEAALATDSCAPVCVPMRPRMACGHKLMFACFSSWIDEKSPVFFS